MYHRFNENLYPSTNIKIDIFKKQVQLINEKKIGFILPDDFDKNFDIKKSKKKVLLTIDDAFNSFYQNAWPILKKEKIPFILFVSTEPVGNSGYMTWEQIKEIEKEDFVFIGNHSHSHKYLVEYNFNDFKKDIDKSIEIFNKNLGYNPVFFSYPFGEYSLEQKKYISSKFKYAFGQNSGVIDLNKDKFELPRFPINEKYGELKRFKSIINYYPLEYIKIFPEEKQLFKNTNPPNFKVKFFKEQKNLENINCYSNEGDAWKKSNVNFEGYTLTIKFREAFKPRRGRINCSLNDNGKWRWFGVQFPIKEN